MTNFTKRTRCLLCEFDSLKVVRREKNNFHSSSLVNKYLSQDSALVECQNCGFAFVESLPSDNQFYTELYADGERDVSIDFFYSGKYLIFEEVLLALKRLKRSGGKLLDIGTGTGRFVFEAAKLFSSSGIELSPASVNFAKSQNLPVENRNFYDANFERDAYDIITIIDVLEHLTDPAKALRTLRELLMPEGIIYIKVPNYKAQAFKQDLLKKMRLSKAGIMQDYVHINHFSRESLSKFLSQNGFQIIESGFSAPEIWDLRWKNAPKSYFYRVMYNVVVRTISYFLNSISLMTKRDFGLNFFIIAKRM